MLSAAGAAGAAGCIAGGASGATGTAGVIAGTAGVVTGTAGIVTGTAGVVTRTAGIIIGTAGVVTGTAGIVAGTAGVVARSTGRTSCRNRFCLTIAANRTIPMPAAVLGSCGIFIDYPVAITMIAVTIFIPVVGYRTIVFAFMPMAGFIRSPC